MMLSMFHHHEHNQHNNQDQSSADEPTRPLSTDLASNGSSGEYGQINTSPLSSSATSGGCGESEAQPQDLSLRSKRQDEQEIECRCQLCNLVLTDQIHLIQHMNDVHGHAIPGSQSPVDSPMNGIQSSTRNGESVPRLSNGNETMMDHPGGPCLQCPMCNVILTGDAEFFDHFLRHHNNDSGAESINALLAPAMSSEMRNGNAGTSSKRSRKVVQEDGRTKETAYCDICNKEFCNSWFLKTHKAKVHGISSDDPDSAHRQHIQSSNGNGSHHSAEQTPKTSPASSVFDPTSNLGNPMAAMAFGTLEQQQLAAFGQQQSLCPMCHQYFPNPIILQSHLLTAHSGLMMNPAAAVYAASMMSSNPLANGAFFQQQQTSGKNLQQQHQQQQQQMAAIAAAAAMLGFGAAPPTDPMTAAMTGSQMDYFSQGMQQPLMLQPTFGASALGGAAPTGLKPSKLGQPHFGLMGTMDDDKSTLPMQQTPTKNMEAYCEICQKEFCNKYFLRTHRMNKHGILDESPKSNGAHRSITKSPTDISPGHRPKESMTDLKRDFNLADLGRGSMEEDDGAPPVSKMVKLMESGAEASSSSMPTSTNGQFPCNLCVKTFPSMFALVAHKYRDHGTFDGATASALINPIPVTSQPSSSSSPSLGFGQRQQRKSLDNELAALSSPIKGIAPGQSVDLEAYCEICQKEFCSKYFLKVHRANIHGIGTVTPNSSPSMVTTNGSGTHVPLGVRRSLNGSTSNGSPTPMNFTVGPFKQEQETGRRNSSNGNPSSAAAILMMAAASGVPSGMGLPGRPLVASKNFCDICNKELCNKYFLRTHMLKMHGIVIDENKTVIANINTLDKEKNGELLFRCDLCGEQLASRQQLRAHKQSVHQIVVPAPSTPSLIAPPSMVTVTDSSLGAQQDTAAATSMKRESIEDLIDSLARERNGTSEDRQEDEDGAKGLDFTRTPTGLNSSGTDGREVLCTICGNKYKNARCLRLHILSDHAGIGQNATVKKTGPTCEYCSMEFPDHTELQLHVINEHQHEVRGSVACMAEQAALDALSNSSAFVAAVNSVANAVAEVAAAAGTTPSTPLESMENEVETTPVQQQHTDLPLVTRAKNGTKLFRCSYCNYYTRWISNLSTHEKRHNVGKPADAESGEKPFKCRMCLRSYRYSHSLQRHMEVHRSSAIGLRTTAGTRPSPSLLPENASIPQPAFHANNIGSKTPPALTPGLNGHDHPASVDGPPDSEPGHTTPVNLVLNPTQMVTPSPDKRHHCHLCSKAFGNKELYRMHIMTIHNTILSPEKQTNGNISPKRLFRCRMCRFVSPKSFDDLRMHMFQKHSSTPAYLKCLANGKDAPEQYGLGGKHGENGLDLTAKNGERAKNGGISPSAKPNCVIQPFLMQEKCETGIFPLSAVVYLPVLRRVESSIEASFTFTPIGSDHQEFENGTNGHA